MSSQAAVLTHSGVRPTRRFFAGAGLLSGAMVASGVLTYAFQVLAARTLGAEAYGQIAVLWAATFLASVMLYRPLEQTASRALADRLSRGEEGTTVVRSVAFLTAAALTAAVAVAAIAWRPLTDRLFLGDDAMTAILVLAVAGYGASYFVRGVVSGARWFGGYALTLTVDGLARVAIAAPLLFLPIPKIAAAAVAGAGLASAVVPPLVGRARLRPLRSGSPGREFRIGAALSFAAPAGVIAAADQVLVNGAPLLIMVDGGPSATKVAGIVFAATMLVRVPVYVFQGLAAGLLPSLTHLQARDDLAGFRRTVAQTAGALLLIGAAITVVVAAVGPVAMRILYGSDFTAGRIELAELAAGVGFYLAASTFSQALLALDRAVRAAAGWAVAAVAFVLLYAVLPGSELARASLAFALATLCTLVLLGALLRTIGRR
jgi:O-antigen/teichoic acid export membrane protein